MADFVYDCCKAEIVGKVFKKADIKETKNGKPFATFSVSTGKKVQGEWKGTFRNIVTFAPDWVKAAGAIVEGSRVRVIADVEHRQWDREGVTIDVVQYSIPPFEGYGIEVIEQGGGEASKPKAKAKPAVNPKDFDLGDEVPF
jgi:single-stranded DNA-binding protein